MIPPVRTAASKERPIIRDLPETFALLDTAAVTPNRKIAAALASAMNSGQSTVKNPLKNPSGTMCALAVFASDQDLVINKDVKPPSNCANT